MQCLVVVAAQSLVQYLAIERLMVEREKSYGK
jgi:hypothetical protein